MGDCGIKPGNGVHEDTARATLLDCHSILRYKGCLKGWGTEETESTYPVPYY